MPSFIRKYGLVITSLIVALAMIGIALIFKNTEYENAWLYILGVWLVVQPFWELYLKRNKD